MSSSWTVASVLDAARDYLAKCDLPSPRLEAELLLAHSLNLSRVDLYIHYDRPLGEPERDAFRVALKARSGGMPLQYITGVQAFRHLNLHVEPGVFIPRPETELLVEKVIGFLGGDRPRDKGVRLLELGTGSGAISLSLVKELVNTRVLAVDISEKAIDVAKRNAREHGLEGLIDFCQGDLFSALPGAVEQFDAIIANPPYVPTTQIDGLAPDVRLYEPRTALDGGPEGLAFYEKIIEKARLFLKTGAFIAFEVGQGQAGPVAARLGRHGFSNVEIFCDYGGIERIVVGWN